MDTPSSSELKAFAATARTGSMSAAARLLGIRQPTVSAHIASLEQRCGLELFHRRGRGVVLTEFGVLLQEATSRIYRAEEQAAQLLLSARVHFQGHIRIGAIGPYNVTPVIKAFRASYPGVRVTVRMADSRTIVQRLLDYADDVSVLLHSIDDARVFCVPFRRQPLVVFAPRTHPLTDLPDLAVGHLAGQEFVLREEGSRTRAVFEAGMAAAGVNIRCSVEMGSREGVKEAVAQGLGLGVVASTAFAPDSRIVVLRVDGLELSTHVHVACLRERQASPLIARFLDMVQAVGDELQADTARHAR